MSDSVIDWKARAEAAENERDQWKRQAEDSMIFSRRVIQVFDQIKEALTYYATCQAGCILTGHLWDHTPAKKLLKLFERLGL